MPEVQVIVIEDRSVNFDLMRLPSSEMGWNFALHNKKPKNVRSQGALKYYLDLVSNLKGFAIILLDLKYINVNLESTQISQISEWTKKPAPKLIKEVKVDELCGIYIGMNAVRNSHWKGQIIITSGQIGHEIKDKIDDIMSGSCQNENVEVNFEGELPNKTTLVTTRAIKHFLRQFDEVLWFLQPQPIDADVNECQGWFQDAYHEPETDEQKGHLDAVKERFPGWYANAERAKALLFSKPNVYELRKGNRPFAVSALHDFFERLDLDGVAPESTIILPTEPGFPFLVGLQHLISNLRLRLPTGERNTPVRLLKLGEDTVAMGLKSAGSTIMFQRRLKEGTYGTTGRFFLRALKANIEIGPVAKQFKLAGVLGGADDLDLPKIDDVALPYITDDFIGIAWKTPIGDKEPLFD